MVLKRHNNRSLLTVLLTAIAFVYSCSPVDLDFTEVPAPGRTEEQTMNRAPITAYRNVLLVYSMGFNNLTYALQEDIRDILRNPISDTPRDAILILSHNSKGTNYNELRSPTLTCVTQNLDGTIQKDTLLVMPEETVATSATVLNEVLTYIHQNFKAENYGMLMSSHGSGWAPAGYLNNPSLYDKPEQEDTDDPPLEIFRQVAYPAFYSQDSQEMILTKSMGVHNIDSYNTIEIDIPELAASIPHKLDYIIFDACFMGGIEVAYELRNKTEKIVASQTEIMGDGMEYVTMCSYLFNENGADLEGFCRRYFEYYNKKSGTDKSATISLINCSQLEALAEISEMIFTNHREELNNLQENTARESVQKYYRKSYSSYHKWFYDFEDIVIKCGPTDEELSSFKNAMNRAILFKAATEYIIYRSDLTIDRHSGLSMYLPYSTGRDYLNSFYKTLEWNKATGLVP